MSAPSKAYTIHPAESGTEERVATTSELNSAPGWVTCHREARGMGYWATTQVKGLSPEIFIVSEVDAFHIVEDRSLTIAKQDSENPTGSETVARYQMECVGTWETQYIPVKVCDDKPINSKESQMMYWESDQFIVVMKPRNGGGAKGLAVRPLDKGHIHQTQNWSLNANKTCSITSGWEVWLKSRVREICKHGSVRGFIVNSERRWL